jgi:adenylosuccinate lyase
VIVLAQDPAMTAATQWLERTLDDSANRRLSTPDAYLALDGALVLFENVARGLKVNREVVRRNLVEHLPFMATETILMQATLGGGDRQALHERIRRHTHAASERLKNGEASDLLQRMSADEAFGLSLAQIHALVEPSRFVGRAPEQVDRFLAEEVEPVLLGLRPTAAPLEAAEVRV